MLNNNEICGREQLSRRYMNFLDFPPHFKGKPAKWRKFYASLKKNNLDQINMLTKESRANLDNVGLKRSDWPILMVTRNWVEKNLSYPEVLALSFMRKNQVLEQIRDKTIGYWLDKGQHKPEMGGALRSVWAIVRSGESMKSNYLLYGIEFLLQNQNDDGGFPPFTESISQTYGADQILYILSEVRKLVQDGPPKKRITMAINNTISFLKNSVEWKGEYCGWYLAPETDSNYEKDFSISATSTVINGLIYVNEGKDLIRPAIKWLLTLQNENGGWPDDKPQYDATFWTLRAFSMFLEKNPNDKLINELSESIKKAINWIFKKKMARGKKADIRNNIYKIRGLLQCPTQLMPPDLFSVVQKWLTWLLKDQKEIISSKNSFYEVISHLVICIQEFKEKWNIQIYKNNSRLDKELKDIFTKIQPFFPKSMIFDETLADKFYEAFPNMKLWKIFKFFENNFDISGFFGIIIASGFLLGFFSKENLLKLLDFCSTSILFEWFFLIFVLLLNLAWLGFELSISNHIRILNMYIISLIMAILSIFVISGIFKFNIGLVSLILLFTFMIDVISVTFSSIDLSKIFSEKRGE